MNKCQRRCDHCDRLMDDPTICRKLPAAQPDESAAKIAVAVKDLIETVMLWNSQASAGLDVKCLAGLRDELSAIAAEARATAPQAANDPEAVVRLKAICKTLGLESTIPESVYSDPEGLFAIFGMMRSKIDTLVAQAIQGDAR